LLIEASRKNRVISAAITGGTEPVMEMPLPDTRATPPSGLFVHPMILLSRLAEKTVKKNGWFA